jgi:predicted RNA-binding Zn-ribbon protein involved in translation (DUF1610 family)
VNERKELLNMLKAMWQKGDSPLHRIYPSWEELEANVDVKTRRKMKKERYVIRTCPNCGAKQKVTKPLEDFFPYQNCRSCRHAFYVNKDLTVRKLMDEEKEDMPAAWVRIVEDLYKKKLAIVFRLE